MGAENKAVISSFVEEVIKRGQLKRADDLVAVDFMELDPLTGQQQGYQAPNGKSSGSDHDPDNTTPL
jgi:hypothetical protein